MATIKQRRNRTPPSTLSQIIHSSWTKLGSVVGVLVALLGLFWGFNNYFVNYLFHRESINATMVDSRSFAKQLDADNDLKLQKTIAAVDGLQHRIDIALATQRINIYKDDITEKKMAMEKIRMKGGKISQEFEAALAGKELELQKAKADLDKLLHEQR